MAAVKTLLTSPWRLFTPCNITVYRRIGWLFPVQRCYLSDTLVSSADHLSSGLERYRDLQRYFKRRLKATYKKFSNIPDHSVIYGRHYMYVVEEDGIYRMDKLQSELPPELLFDLGKVSGGDEKAGCENEARRSHWTVQNIHLSPQEKHLAVTLKCSHKEELRCVIMKLEKRKSVLLGSQDIILSIEKVLSLEWATDEVLFYTTLDRLRSSSVFRLDLTSTGSRITSVYEKTQPDVFVEVSLSRDQHILTINSSSRTSSEVLLSDTKTSHLELSMVQPRRQGLLYHVEHWKRQLIILANTGPGQEYQVVQAPLTDPSMSSWVSLFTPEPGTVIKDMDIVGDYCVLVAKMHIEELVLIVFPLIDREKAYIVQLPSWACAIETNKPGLSDQENVIQFLLSSPVHPPVPYCLCPADGLLLSGTKNGSSLQNQADYIITCLEACSQDGTLVPVTLFHSTPVEGLRKAPLLVHVYGAYGRDLNMDFSPEKRFLLEQGWSLAYAHIRGGGERGLSWQRQGSVEGKQKGVEDLHACLHHLFSSGVSAPSLTAVSACSAGAVPVGALCNRHPNMMQAVALQAPFLDVLGTMEDPSLPLSLEDRDEWGDPVGNPKHREIISSYCPLQNITPQHYPSMLLTAYCGDARIPLAGVVKYAEKLKKATETHFISKPEKECKAAPNIVLNIQPGSNHLGPEDFELMLEEEALKCAFLYSELGLDIPRASRKKKR